MACGVDLAQIKAQVQAEESTADDVLLSAYLASAIAFVDAHLRRDLEADFRDGWPAPMDQAVRLIVGHWYSHRSAVDKSAAAVPFGVKDMLAPYRNLG